MCHSLGGETGSGMGTPLISRLRDERRCHVRGRSRKVWLAAYLVKFQIQDVLKLTVRELDIPRSAKELSTLDLAESTEVPIQRANAYINVLMTTDTLWISQLFKDMTTLPPTVFEARLPAFWSVPPKVQNRQEVYLEDEMPFECWLYVNSWQHPHQLWSASSPRPRFQTTPVMVTVIGVDMNRDGIQDVRTSRSTSSLGTRTSACCWIARRGMTSVSAL